MASHSYSISPVSEEDLQTAGEFLYTCKTALPINRLLFEKWPSPSVQKPMYNGAISGSFADAATHDLKAVDAATGEFAGYMAFTRRRPPQAQTPDVSTTDPSSPPATPPGLNPQVFQAVVAIGTLNQSVQSIDHYEILYIATAPAHRRQGLATQLLDRALQQAEAENIPIITVSEPEAHPFFISKGFEETGRDVEWDLAKWAPTPKAGFGPFRLTQVMWQPYCRA